MMNMRYFSPQQSFRQQYHVNICRPFTLVIHVVKCSYHVLLPDTRLVVGGEFANELSQSLLVHYCSVEDATLEGAVCRR